MSLVSKKTEPYLNILILFKLSIRLKNKEQVSRQMQLAKWRLQMNYWLLTLVFQMI